VQVFAIHVGRNSEFFDLVDLPLERFLAEVFEQLGERRRAQEFLRFQDRLERGLPLL
jgi:hypothetical protein